MGEGAREGQGWGGGRDGVGEACGERWGSDGTPLRREALEGTGRNWKRGTRDKEGWRRGGDSEEGLGQGMRSGQRAIATVSFTKPKPGV